jgi:hypothetical protein
MDGRIRPCRATYLFTPALLLIVGATACGASKNVQPETTTGQTLPAPTVPVQPHRNGPGDKRAARLKSKLTAAGFIVHYEPVTLRRGFSNASPQTKVKQTPAERARVQRLRRLQLRNDPAPTPPAEILRVDITEGNKHAALLLGRQLVALDGLIASQGFQTRQQTAQVAAIIKRMRSQSSHELFVNVYNSVADTAGFRSQQAEQRQRLEAQARLSGVPTAPGTITPYRIVGPDVYVNLTTEQIGPSGFLVDPFSKAEFDRFVALAEGK